MFLEKNLIEQDFNKRYENYKMGIKKKTFFAYGGEAINIPSMDSYINNSNREFLKAQIESNKKHSTMRNIAKVGQQISLQLLNQGVSQGINLPTKSPNLFQSNPTSLGTSNVTMNGITPVNNNSFGSQFMTNNINNLQIPQQSLSLQGLSGNKQAILDTSPYLNGSITQTPLSTGQTLNLSVNQNDNKDLNGIINLGLNYLPRIIGSFENGGIVNNYNNRFNNYKTKKQLNFN